MRKFLTCAVSTAAIVAASGAVAQDRPSSLSVATASAGGVFAIYGEGLASIVSDVVGVPTSTRQTQGPAQNMVLVQTGQSDIGLVTTGPAYEGIVGQLELAPGLEHSDVRALFAMYPTPFQIITLSNSGIESIEDFDGARVGAGPRGGTGGVYWPIWMEDMGINANFQYGPIGDQASQLADGRLDVIATAGGIPHPSFMELETTQDVQILGMTDAQIAEIVAANPYAVPFMIPADTYDTIDEDVATVAMWNFAIVHKDMDDDLAYEITKAILENNDRMVQTHASATDTLPKNIANNSVLPIHPGALRYFDEIGVEVPEDLRPE